MHPETEHGLQIQLATALRERDAANARADGFESALNLACKSSAQTQRELETALAAARRELDLLRKRDDAARAMLTQLRAALDEDTTFLGAVLRVEMDKWLGLAAPAAGEEK